MKKYFIIAVFSLSFIACSSLNDKDRLGTGEYSLVQEQDKFVLLDSMTSQETNYMQVINDKMIAIYNLPAHTICVFDLEKGVEVGKVQLHKDGPNSVRGIQGFYYHSSDSIWLYQSWEKNLVLVNNKGIVLNKKNIQDRLQEKAFKTNLSVAPFPLTDLPILKIDDMFVLQGMNGPEVVDGLLPACTILFDMKKDTIKIANEYPPVYGDRESINDNWGTFPYRVVPYTLNKESEMILSFPADDNIYVYNIKSGEKKCYFAGYSQYKEMRPIAGTQKSDLQRHYLEQMQYAGIFYDEYNNVYYRLVTLPIYDYDIYDEKTQKKPMAVVILNSNFDKVGEVRLEHGDYKYRNTFVSKDGLQINVHSEDDDYLKFVTYKLKENEK